MIPYFEGRIGPGLDQLGARTTNNTYATDLAHLTMVAENVSIIAAIDILDEQLVDAQESSTRYQDFTKRRYYTPPEIAESHLGERYRGLCDRLFDLYHRAHGAVVGYYERRYADQRPASTCKRTRSRTTAPVESCSSMLT